MDPPKYDHPMPPPAGHMSGVQQVIVTGVPPAFGPQPMHVTCSHCGQQVMTETDEASGLLTWLLVGGLCVFGCWLGCCLIPFCVADCKDIEHRCPSCKAFLGVYRRIK
ncbi:unnamed protein product [Oppiella nova]|uniref:LITAF domain-containing protein n=1 Tax=Oppiella nova TaxID=334625 RepID=A0A7R9LQ60_9ACAR|nr:unnamed protein product [Oppiella nova]CAG2165519.1 unnamed protein product [Oppiella nova]